MTRGGHRIGSGRPKGSNKWGESTQAIRIPISKVADVKTFLENKNRKTSVIVSTTLASDCELGSYERAKVVDINYHCPLYASHVRAGFPSPADDHIETHLDLNAHLIKHPAATFFVIASGDSMTDAGIQSGDMLIVDKSLEATHGKIVIAAIDGELTVKRLSRQAGKVKLLPANNRYGPIDITNEHDLVIWGVVTHVIHSAS
ncbi:MAG: translesion error-prone DNA polymerase V autoproteolytic subunit [Legionellaceae bacterium]|nr:translesion error-prone DNA polymerase V autoproteolytic subunit [Legionellaceae bacterium]